MIHQFFFRRYTSKTQDWGCRMILFTHVLGGKIYSPSKDGSQLKNEENVVRTTEYTLVGKERGLESFSQSGRSRKIYEMKATGNERTHVG